MSINLSLDRLERAVQHLPTYTRPTCHIAGTNGKGSVTATLSSIFRSTTPSLRVGRYNSPHLVTLHDCITIDEEPVDVELYKLTRAKVENVDAELGTKLSNFEILTLTALQVFEQVQVDVAIVEVGMGGRLDATNIIPDKAILVSALTNVGLDHQAFLGDTVIDIAREKAGIARNGRPFVLGVQKHQEVADIVYKITQERGSTLASLLPIIVTDEEVTPLCFNSNSFIPPSPRRISCRIPSIYSEVVANFPLHGDHQLENLSTALTIISVLREHNSPLKDQFCVLLTPSAIANGISSIQWRGRLSFHTITSPKPLIVLVDGAHNPASAKTLSSYITYLLGLASLNYQTFHLTFILGLSHSPPKTPHQTFSPILPPRIPTNSHIDVKTHIALLDFSPPDGMPWVKSVPPKDLFDVAKELVPNADFWIAEDDSQPSQSLSAALEWASKACQGEGLVVVAGSLYLVADLYRLTCLR